MRKIIIPISLFLITQGIAVAQQTGDRIQREVRLYNPFRPTLSEANKRNFFPDMTDTTSIRHEFTYNVTPEAFSPAYTVSQIRPAALLPDPLPKLYKSYLNLGIGNYFTPLGELSIATERSKTGMLAFYARHFSSNGKIQLDNLEKVYAGYMDNEAALYGRKFFRSAVLSGSLDFAHITRHAYGYDTIFSSWESEREDVRLRFMDVGATTSIASLRNDSGRLVYDARLGYNYFRQSEDLWQHNVGLQFDAGRTIKALSPRGSARRAGVSDFYGSLHGRYDLTFFDVAITDKARHVLSVNPALGKRSNEWNFNLGFQAVTETRTFSEGGFDEYKTRVHIYPDVSLGIAVIPSFLNFNLGLDGNLVDNSAPEAVMVNPFLLTNGSLYKLPYTDNEIVARVGLSGSVVPSTMYKVSASYTVFRDMPFYSNVVWDNIIITENVGGFFEPVISDGNLANINGEVVTSFAGRFSAKLRGDYYHYTLTDIQFPYNMPSWDGSFQLNYNLRDKILAGASLNAIGQRDAFITMKTMGGPQVAPKTVELPMHMNLSLTAEYRYTKILSFWVKLNNISFNRNYEWAFYPSQRFLALVGFSYSL